MFPQEFNSLTPKTSSFIHNSSPAPHNSMKLPPHLHTPYLSGFGESGSLVQVVLAVDHVDDFERVDVEFTFRVIQDVHLLRRLFGRAQDFLCLCVRPGFLVLLMTPPLSDIPSKRKQI